MDLVDDDYRSDPRAAQALIEQMQPVPSRRWWCIALLADTMQAAHRANPSRWGVTLFDNVVRLNVGMIEVFVFGPTGQVYLVLDARTLLTLSQAYPHLNQEVQDQLAAYQRGTWQGDYASVAGSLGMYVELEHLPIAYPLLRPAHQALIGLAARTRRHPMTGRSHSPGVLDYLRAETGWPLPQPNHAPTTPRSQ